MDLGFDFTIDKENNSITVNREFNAELSLVWDAYTKSEILEQWWAPKPWKAKTKSMEFKKGGHWHYAMCGPAGEEHWAYSTYQEIEFYDYYLAIENFANEDGVVNRELPQSKWRVTFTSKGERTSVITHIAYNNLNDLETIIKMGFKEGYTKTMESLDDLFASLLKK